MEYKLLKWYPSLPLNMTAGSIAKLKAASNNLLEHTYVVNGQFELAAGEVEASAEYWEVVKQQPLFISSDGFEIFPEESWYYVKDGDTEVKETSTLAYGGNMKNMKPVLRFKHLEIAQFIAASNNAANVLKTIQKKGLMNVLSKAMGVNFVPNMY